MALTQLQPPGLPGGIAYGVFAKGLRPDAHYTQLQPPSLPGGILYGPFARALTPRPDELTQLQPPTLPGGILYGVFARTIIVPPVVPAGGGETGYGSPIAGRFIPELAEPTRRRPMVQRRDGRLVVAVGLRSRIDMLQGLVAERWGILRVASRLQGEYEGVFVIDVARPIADEEDRLIEEGVL